MFNSIVTSRENKEVVSKLTRLLNLGAENMVACIASAYSQSKNRHLNLTAMVDAHGMERISTILGSKFVISRIDRMLKTFN